MSRGVNRTSTFLDDYDRTFFLGLLARIVSEGWFKVHAYCLMDNHFHMLVETPMGGLGRIMQVMLTRYAMRFNKRHDRVGHLFQGRYKAILVEDGDYFLECSRYIHLNPARSKMAVHFEDYQWSSYPHYLGKLAATHWVTTDRTISCFESADEYAEFVRGAVDEALETALETTSTIYGSKAFVEHMRSLLVNKKTKVDREIDAAGPSTRSAYGGRNPHRGSAIFSRPYEVSTNSHVYIHTEKTD